MKTLTTAELTKVVSELTKKVTDLEERLSALKTRDRGPASTRAMTEKDAERIILGDLKDVSHKKAAEKLGLSYGQIYSARGGYTFKHIVDRARSERIESK